MNTAVPPFMKKEDVFIFYLRITGIYKKRDEKAGVYSIGVSRKCLLIQVNAVKTPLRHNTAVPLFMKKEDVFIFCLRITGIYNKRNEKAGVYSIGVSRKSFLIQVYAVKTPLRQQGLQNIKFYEPLKLSYIFEMYATLATHL